MKAHVIVSFSPEEICSDPTFDLATFCGLTGYTSGQVAELVAAGAISTIDDSDKAMFSAEQLALHLSTGGDHER